ncbi:hypothetical protein [Paenibacillus humicus]|uniref:hypothetical protein n=1 Tax=Paenibacillus humicus TaxID=412861 RepID=UPI003D2C4BA8
MTKKYITIPLVLFFLLFLIRMFYINTGLFVEFQMKTNSQSIGQVFFRNTNSTFNENDSKKFNLLKPSNWHNYRFKVKGNSSEIRIDPVNIAGEEIFIDNVKVYKIRGFKKETIFLNESLFIGGNQIGNLSFSNNSIKINSLGSDPYLTFNLLSNDKEYEHYFYLKDILILLFLFGICFFLVRFFKGMSTDNIHKYIIYVIVFAAFFGKCLYYSKSINLGSTPDEIAHLSYVAYLSENKKIIPDYSNFYLYDTNGNKTETKNYLEHPSIYYHFIGLFLPDNPKDVMKNYDQARNINIGIISIGIIIILYLGWLQRFSVLGHLLYSVTVTSIPMFGFEGAGINNDNLAVVGGALTLLGAQKLIKGNLSWSSYLFTFIGFSTAVISKITAGIMCGILIFFVFLYFFKSIKNKREIFNSKVITVLVCLLPASYFILLKMRYGVFQPSLQNLDFEAFKQTGFYIPPDERVILPFTSYTKLFLQKLWWSWSQVLSHVSVPKTSLFESVHLILLPILAIICLFIKKGKEFIFAKIGYISLFVFMIIHFLTVLKAHQLTGYTGGIQARYYFPLVAVVFLLSSGYLDKIKSLKLKFLVVICLVCFSVYSDFYYFMMWANFI